MKLIDGVQLFRDTIQKSGVEVLPNKLHIVEGSSGHFYYHLSVTGENGKPTLCGETNVLHTEIPLESWGRKGHLNERYCPKCSPTDGLNI